MHYDFNNPWGLDQEECVWLRALCHTRGITDVIEFGPGNSTIAMLNGGVKFIVSYEQDGDRAKELREKFAERATVITYLGNQFPIRSDLPYSDFDFAFIDGPCGDTIAPARINAALFCFRRARLIAFHDSKRDQGTIDIMRDLGMREFMRLDSKRGIVVLEHARA